MLRLFGWDHSGVAVRRRLPWSPEMAQGGFLGAPDTDLLRAGRPVLYDELIPTLLQLIAKTRHGGQDLDHVLDWSVGNAVDPDEWPAGHIVRRLAAICRAGKSDDEDAEDLVALLGHLTEPGGPEAREPIPFTLPVPQKLQIRGTETVLLGSFLSGKRHVCDAILRHGGRIGATVGPKTSYVVIGALRGYQWQEGESGEQIRALIDRKKSGNGAENQGILLSELSWIRALAANEFETAKESVSI